MSRKNTREVKAQRREARAVTSRPLSIPDAERQAVIAAAIREAAASIILIRPDGTTSADGIAGHCTSHAAVAALVLSDLTGNEYRVVGGSYQVGTGADMDHPEGELFYSCVATDPVGRARNEFHAWSQAIRGGDAVIADFSLHEVPELARAAGVEWQRDDMPGWFWGRPADARGLRLRYRPDALTTTEVRRAVSDIADAVTMASTEALRSL